MQITNKTKLVLCVLMCTMLTSTFCYSKTNIKHNQKTTNNLSPLFSNIKNIIGEDKYIKNKRLIHFLFKKQDKFYVLNNIDYVRVYKLLYDNSLLSTDNQTPKTLKINFLLKTKSPLKAFKILKDVLTKIGYISFSTLSLGYSKNNVLEWNIAMQSIKYFDLIDFTQALLSCGVRLTHVTNLGDDSLNSHFAYELEFAYSYVDKAISVANYEKTRLPFSFEPVLIRVLDAKQIRLSYFNKWYAFVTFYDKNLNQLDYKKSFKQRNVFYYKIPKHTRYIKIQDTYAISNIHKGIWVLLK